MNMRTLYLTFAALGLSIHPAQAQSLPTLEKVAVAGKAQQVSRIVSLDPECQPTELPAVTVLEGPRQGQVTTAVGQDYPNFPITNPRIKCNTRKTPALEVIYTAPAGATGDDMFTVEFVDRNGTPQRIRYHVTIR